MNTIMSLLKNAKNLDISINTLLESLVVVCNATQTKKTPNEIIEQFSEIFQRINDIWGVEGNKEWDNIKAVADEYNIELFDGSGRLEPFRIIYTRYLYGYSFPTIFAEVEFVTALAGKNNRDILMVLFEHYGNHVGDTPTKLIAKAILESLYDNQDGGTQNG